MLRMAFFIASIILIASLARPAACLVGFCSGICFAPCGAGCLCMKRQDIETQGYCFSEQAEKRMLEAGWKLIP